MARHGKQLPSLDSNYGHLGTRTKERYIKFANSVLECMNSKRRLEVEDDEFIFINVGPTEPPARVRRAQPVQPPAESLGEGPNIHPAPAQRVPIQTLQPPGPDIPFHQEDDAYFQTGPVLEDVGPSQATENVTETTIPVRMTVPVPVPEDVGPSHANENVTETTIPVRMTGPVPEDVGPSQATENVIETTIPVRMTGPVPVPEDVGPSQATENVAETTIPEILTTPPFECAPQDAVPKVGTIIPFSSLFDEDIGGTEDSDAFPEDIGLQGSSTERRHKPKHKWGRGSRRKHKRGRGSRSSGQNVDEGFIEIFQTKSGLRKDIKTKEVEIRGKKKSMLSRTEFSDILCTIALMHTIVLELPSKEYPLLSNALDQKALSNLKQLYTVKEGGGKGMGRRNLVRNATS